MISITSIPLDFLLLSFGVRDPQTPKSWVRIAQLAQAARIGHFLQIFLASRIPLRVSPSKILGSWPVHFASLKNPGSSNSSRMDSGVGVKCGLPSRASKELKRLDCLSVVLRSVWLRTRVPSLAIWARVASNLVSDRYSFVHKLKTALVLQETQAVSALALISIANLSRGTLETMLCKWLF